MEVGVVVVTRFFFGHPVRLGGAAVALVVAAGLAWYLGSPLFLRTYTSETLRAAAPAAVAPGVLAQGELRYVDSVHYGKGPVRIVELEGRRIVRFDGVAITNAPDIHVYLSRETGGKWTESTSLYLGALRATDGSFNYEVPAGMTVADYKSVVVWCRAFGVLITWADLT